MMKFNDVLDNVADQNKGRWLTLTDPFSGKPTGMRFRVAGPDSDIARLARLALTDELVGLAGDDGTVSAEGREIARLNCLAALVLDWEVEEDDGRVVPFNSRNVKILLRVFWVQQQVDAFAADRRHYSSVDDGAAAKADR